MAPYCVVATPKEGGTHFAMTMHGEIFAADAPIAVDEKTATVAEGTEPYDWSSSRKGLLAKLGVDVRRDIVANIGGEFAFLMLPLDEERIPPLVFALTVRNPDVLAGAIVKLAGEGTLTREGDLWTSGDDFFLGFAPLGGETHAMLLSPRRDALLEARAALTGEGKRYQDTPRGKPFAAPASALFYFDCENFLGSTLFAGEDDNAREFAEGVRTYLNVQHTFYARATATAELALVEGNIPMNFELLGFLVGYSVSRAMGPPMEAAEPMEVTQSFAEEEMLALDTLGELRDAQMLFRENDAEGDGILDYGTLAELGEAGLIDVELAAGRRGPYIFGCIPGAKPEFLWYATATFTPEEAPAEGEEAPALRHFFTNYGGGAWARQEPFGDIDPETCEPPADAERVQ
jgi:hypothetical protein